MTEPGGSGEVVPPGRLLPQLVKAVLELGIQLDVNATRLEQQDRVVARTWIELIRQLYLIDALSGPRSLVVTGEQGAGKTLLMRNLYPEARDWLQDNAGRGEKNAVQIVEKDGLPAPRGTVTYRVPGDEALRTGALTRTEEFGSADREQWRKLVRGEDPDVLLCTLEVPTGFWGLDGTGFVLLPGLERRAERHWQTLMKMVLATSPAAIIVADERRMADGAQRQLLEHLRAGSDDVRFVVAVSRCEASAPDVIAERVRRAVDVFGVEEADVVPIGKDVDAPAGWPDRLLERVDRLRSGGADHRLLQIDVLRAFVDGDLLALLDTAHQAKRRQALDTEAVDNAENFLGLYDQEADAVRSLLEKEMARNFDPHIAAAGERLHDDLRSSGGWEGFKTRFGDYVRLRRSEQYRRLAAQVDQAWSGPEGQDPLRSGGPLHAQLTTVSEVARLRWETVSQRFTGSITPDGRFDAEVQRALVGRPLESARDAQEAATVLRERSLDEVIRALPAITLYVRTFAVERARPDGTIARIDPGEQASWIERLGGDRKQMLMALGLLLGGDLLADGDLDTPANLANLGRILFTGGTAANGAAAGGAGAAAGGAVAAGGMALAGSVLLAAVGVGVAAAVLLKAANDQEDEREYLAEQHLQAYREKTEQAIRSNVNDLLDLTREALAARLNTALGVDRGLNAQFGLLTATTNLENVRTRMQKALGRAEFG